MDLDEDELRATRRMNGADKPISRNINDLTDYLINREDSIEYKTNDKNVANIEKDIKILKSYLNNSSYKESNSDFFKNGGWEIVGLDIPLAIEHLLKDYERQKQRNEEHQKINGELREQVKQLDKTNNDLRLLYRRTANKLLENGKEELAGYFLAQINEVPTFTIDDDIDYYTEYYKLKNMFNKLKSEDK